MPRGQADDGQYAVKEVAASISDMGELAARLGSIVTYDKRGDVVDFDNFEEPVFKWETAYGNTGDYTRLDSTQVKSGSQAIKLHTLSQAGSQAKITKAIFPLASLSIGLEVSLTRPNPNTYFDALIKQNDGDNAQYAKVRYDSLTGTIYILDSTNAYKEIDTGIKLYPETFTFHTIKLVADFATGYYKRLLLDNLEYDISDEALYSEADGDEAYVWFEIGTEDKAADGGDCYIDNIIWTQAEP